MALPTNFTIINGDAEKMKAIRDLAAAAEVEYLTSFYLAERKEAIAVSKEIIAVTATNFYRGEAAREFLNIPTTGKASVDPASVPDGCQVFIQSTSQGRKIPKGSKILLQTAEEGEPAPAPTEETEAEAPAPAEEAPAPAAPEETSAASGNIDNNESRDDTNPRPAKQARTEGGDEEGETAAAAAAATTEGEANNNNNNQNTPEEFVDDGTEFGSKVLRLRLQREGARSAAALQASLIWNDIADLDLSCITPDGVEIYYGNKESNCGGWLDVDMNVIASTASREPVENIFWASAPSGKYVFRVTNFHCHTDPKTPEFTDMNRSVPYRVYLTKNGKKEVFEGSVKHKEKKVCCEFELEGDGALGSFVVMPPSDKKTTFKESCEKNNVTYNKGNGYYAVARKEDIQDYKEMLLQDIEKDTFTIGATACRKKLGWPVGVKLRKGPKDIPQGFRLFVQSTSHNRVIPPGTHVLMKVSVQEALKHRPAHNTQNLSETHTMGTSNGAQEAS